jgi:hypothetical protein
MAKVEIFEQNLTQDNKTAKVTILRGGLNTDNPSAIMNEAVSKYVGNQGYNQFVEIPLNNPWVRVIISGINDLEYKPFKNQTINQKIDKHS